MLPNHHRMSETNKDRSPHILADITPPGIRTAVANQSEWVRQQNDPCHPIFQQTSEMSCLHSRSSFISSLLPLITPFLTHVSVYGALPQLSEQHHTGHGDHRSGETSRQLSSQVLHLEKSQLPEEPSHMLQNQHGEVELHHWA